MNIDDTFTILREYRYQIAITFNLTEEEFDEAFDLLHTTVPEEKCTVTDEGEMILFNLTHTELIEEVFCLGASCERMNSELGIEYPFSYEVSRAG